MPDNIALLVHRMRELEDELEDEFERRRKTFSYKVKQRRVIFERETLRQHRAIRQKLISYVTGARPMVVLTAPIIYLVIIPLVMLDIFVTIYQACCFPVYRIEKVSRANFITFDRRHLSYLNGLEKLNCIYCSYANGLLAYSREVAARTELYWCPIKHAKRMAGLHRHYPEFADYGDGEGYKRCLRAARGEQ